MDYSALPGLIKKEVENWLITRSGSLFVREGFESNHPDKQLEDWLRMALKLPSSNSGFSDHDFMLASELDFIASSTAIYTGLATGASLSDLLPAAAGVYFLHRASALFDAIQDRDGSSSLVEELGTCKNVNIALILMSLGQEIITETLLEAANKAERTQRARLYKIITKTPATVCLGFKGQILDTQEQDVPLTFRFQHPEYYLQKVGLKTGQVYSYLTELGATIGNSSENTIKEYRQFGFAFGVTLHLIDDLHDFLLALFKREKSRDLRKRYLSLPFIYAFQFLSEYKRNKLLDLWLHKQELNGSMTISSVADEEISALLLDTPAFLQTLALATRYSVVAEDHLVQLDRGLKKEEHQAILRLLKELTRECYSAYFQARSARAVAS